MANTTIDLRTFKVESATLTMVGKANPNRAVKEPKVRGSNPLGRIAKVPAKVLLCFGFPQHCHSHQFGWWARTCRLVGNLVGKTFAIVSANASPAR